MRTISIIFGFFISLSFFGCRENPVNPSETILDSRINEIPICCCVFDPVTGECNIKGEVTYMLETLEYIADSVKMKIKLEMDAELCTKLLNPIKCEIYGNSQNNVFVKVNGKLLFDKTYRISHRSDLILCVQYLITTESVSVMKMNLLQIVGPN